MEMFNSMYIIIFEDNECSAQDSQHWNGVAGIIFDLNLVLWWLNMNMITTEYEYFVKCNAE